MSIYDFTPEEMEEIRIFDASINKRGGQKRYSRGVIGSVSHKGNALWEYRMTRKIDQRTLAEEMGLCQQSVSRMERGDTPISRYAAEWMEAHPNG